jgi:xylulokinase
MGEYFIGSDIGTSGCKTVIIDEAGHAVAKASQEYALDFLGNNRVEIDPYIWYKAFLCTIKTCMETSGIRTNSVAAVGLSGQMVSTVPVDKDGHPTRPCIVWLDSACTQEVEDIQHIMGNRQHQITKNPLQTTTMLPKMLWIKKNEPKAWKNTYKILTAKDFIQYNLTRCFSCDHTDASCSQIYDMKKAAWSEEIMKEFGLSEGIMPDIHYSAEIVGRITAQAAVQTGLPEGLPVVAGAGDASCECFAAGMIGKGKSLVRLGTAGVISVIVDAPLADSEMKCVISGYYKPGLWVLQGATQGFGLFMRWLRDNLNIYGSNTEKAKGNEAYALICEEAEKAPPGSDGLIFHPFVTGGPYWKQHLKGAFYGIQAEHAYSHFARATLEGAVFILNEAKLFTERIAGYPIQSCVAVGGGTKNDVWAKMVANTLNIEMRIIEDVDACFGAAYYAAMACGHTESFTQQAKEIKKIIVPDETKEIYQNAFKKYSLLHEYMDRLGLALSEKEFS